MTKQLRQALPPGRQKLAADRSFGLFKRMCADAGVDDPDLLELYLIGASLVGDGGDAPEFPAQSRPAWMKVEDVQRASKWTRRRAMGKQGAAQPTQLEKDVWAKTKEELGEGWLRGPFTEAELVAEVGPLAVVARRFGISQQGETRVIDDCSATYVNA